MNNKKLSNEAQNPPLSKGAVIGCPSFGMIINNLK